MNFKKVLPHIVAVIVFIACSFIYFSPILDGKQLNQSDMNQFSGMSKSIDDYHRNSGNYSEWTNSMFSGMPTYQIKNAHNFNVIEFINVPLTLGPYSHSAGILFLMALGFYIFLVVMGVNPWMSIFAGLIYALGSYNIIIIGVGHITKAWAMAMIAPILAGMILVMKKKYLRGVALFTLALGMQLSFNHIQITYYTLITSIVLGISYLVYCIKDKEFKELGKVFCILVIGALIAVMPSSAHLMVNQEYVKQTMRGGSELNVKPQQNNQSSVNDKGLDIDYAYNWSYGKGETMTLLIPDYKGGGGADIKRISDGTITKNRMRELQSTAPKIQDQNAFSQIANSYLTSNYFGKQPFTAGPVYFGAIVIFLALLGFIVLDNRWRWWLLIATIISILLSWGNNFMILNEWLFYHLPFYNKFRTPSMALVIANVTMCMVAFLGLKAFFESDNKKLKSIALYVSGGVTLLITLLCSIAPNLFTDFSAPNDNIFREYLGESFISSLVADRESLFTRDAFRSFIFIAIACASLLLYNMGKIKNQTIIFCVIGLCAVIDLWAVDKRYVNNETNYQTKYEALPSPTNAETTLLDEVMNKKPNHYRVYNMSLNAFNDASTSYFFPSIGGYNAAKLQRYQDVIDFYFTNPNYKQNNLNDTSLLISNPFRQVMLQASTMKGFSMPNIGVLNMLDTRYIIINQDVFIENTEACGPAWFVNNIKWANNADEEILALDNFNPKETVVINKEFSSQIKEVKNDENAKVTFINDEWDNPEKRVYKTQSSSAQVLVFSEIYYKDSWKAYLDGKEVPYFRADYLLRAMYVPAGNHTIEFICKSDTVKKGRIINLAGSVLLIALLLSALCLPFIEKLKKNKQID